MRLLNEYVSDLAALQEVDFETYTENKLLRRAVERTLQLAVEACLDIGQHIIALEGLRVPADNKDVFVILGEESIVPSPLLPALVAMAKFRNLIVHDYARIDDSVVFGILRRQLGDLNAFAQAVAAYLEAG